MNAHESADSPIGENEPHDDSRYVVKVSDSQSRIDVDFDRLKAVTVDVLRHEDVHSAEISVAIIDGETMQRLNREHLGHDYDTDVLSFLLDCNDPVASTDDRPRGTGKILDGEILISADVAAKAAGDFGWATEDETTLYLVHGLLHLVGYDDLTDSERTTMRKRERLHLARWNLHPTYHEDSDLDESVERPHPSPHDSHTSVRG